ncbi:MAG: hypothetical protein IJQ02_00930, partial [Oscillospiraceae bacterium]|nr:hypothetical protein [Oscillospiraceae bacterium]
LLPQKVGEQVKLLKENMISRIIEDLTLLHRYSAFIRQIPTVDIIAGYSAASPRMAHQPAEPTVTGFSRALTPKIRGSPERRTK